MAALAGEMDDAAILHNRSQRAFRAMWSKDRMLMCPRASNGTMHCPRDPRYNSWVVSEDEGYTEGDAEQWLWFVPHDIKGAIYYTCKF